MQQRPAKEFFVYITASKSRGVLYVGMTSDLAGRAWEHRECVLEGFTKRYWAARLVYCERHESALSAARRERAMKRWHRDWKFASSSAITRPGPIFSRRSCARAGTSGEAGALAAPGRIPALAGAVPARLGRERVRGEGRDRS